MKTTFKLFLDGTLISETPAVSENVFGITVLLHRGLGPSGTQLPRRCWQYSEQTTGFRMSINCATKADARANLFERLERAGIDRVKAAIESRRTLSGEDARNLAKVEAA